jgi:hypothetical protein
MRSWDYGKEISALEDGEYLELLSNSLLHEVS